MASTAGGSVNDFRKMGKSSMEAGLSIAGWRHKCWGCCW